MAANIFNVAAERVDSLSELFRREQNSTWKNILYYPNSFKPTDRNSIVITEKKFFEVSLKDTDVERVRFVRCTFVRCLFIGASFVECEFIDCDFRDTNTSKIRIQRCLFDPFCFEGNFDLKNDTNIAIDLYHSLYRNASEEHQPTHAIESLYRMKKAERAHLDPQIKRGVINRRTFVKRKLAHLVSDFVSGYGLRILHALRLLVIVVFGFSFLNYLFRNNIFPIGQEISFIDTVYFTCITMTTLEFGDIVPVTESGKLFVTFQALSGIVVISIFLAAVTNRAIRSR